MRKNYTPPTVIIEATLVPSIICTSPTSPGTGLSGGDPVTNPNEMGAREQFADPFDEDLWTSIWE